MSKVSFEVQGKDDAIFVKITEGEFADVAFVISGIETDDSEEGKITVDYELISTPNDVNLVGDPLFESVLNPILIKIITHALSGENDEVGNSDTE